MATPAACAWPGTRNASSRTTAGRGAHVNNTNDASARVVFIAGSPNRRGSSCVPVRSAHKGSAPAHRRAGSCRTLKIRSYRRGCDGDAIEHRLERVARDGAQKLAVGVSEGEALRAGSESRPASRAVAGAGSASVLTRSQSRRVSAGTSTVRASSSVLRPGWRSWMSSTRRRKDSEYWRRSGPPCTQPGWLITKRRTSWQTASASGGGTALGDGGRPTGRTSVGSTSSSLERTSYAQLREAPVFSTISSTLDRASPSRHWWSRAASNSPAVR